MKERRICMGMPVIVEIVDDEATKQDLDDVFEYIDTIDKLFDLEKENSEVSLINAKKLALEDASKEVREVFVLCEETKKETDGYFDFMRKDGVLDPSGLLKGWVIHHISNMLKHRGFKNFCIDIAGDIEAHGHNKDMHAWGIGIQNPFDLKDVVKIIEAHNVGIATTGTHKEGSHLYNPKRGHEKPNDIISLTVIAENAYEADRLATACFAMGNEGLYFLEKLPHAEGYAIDKEGKAVMTTGFSQYII